MPTYKITGPDGKVYRVTGEGTADEALQHLQSQQAAPAPAAPQAPAAPVEPTWGDRGREALQGAVAGFDKAALGVKGMLPQPIQRAGDWVDEKLGMRKLTPQTAVQAPDTWAGTLGSIGTDVALQAPLAALAGPTLGAQVALGGATQAALTPGDLAQRGKAAAGGAAGAAAGYGLSKALGRLAKPIGDKTAEVMALEAKGIDPTFGQGMGSKGGLGKAVNRAEEAAMSAPGVGAPLRNTRQAALDKFSTVVREGALPPGVDKTAARTTDSLRTAFNESYDDVLKGVPVNNDMVKWSPNTAVPKVTATLPITSTQRADAKMLVREIQKKYLQAIPKGGAPDANVAHAIQSEIRANAAKMGSSSVASERNMGEALAAIAEDFGNTWRKGVSPKALKAIQEVDKAYASYVPVRHAAKTNAVSRGVDDFTPNVLLRALRTTDRTPNKSTFLAGNRPQQALAQAAENVLGNKVPDSGTSERIFTTMGLGGAAALGQLPAALAGGGALAAYGTKPVQDYLMGRLGTGATQEALLQALRRFAPYGAAGGAGVGAQLTD